MEKLDCGGECSANCNLPKEVLTRIINTLNLVVVSRGNQVAREEAKNLLRVLESLND